MRIPLRLEADNIISYQSNIDGSRNIAGHELPAANIRPGNVDELLHNDRWMLLANDSRSKVAVVIVQQNNRYSLAAHHFDIHNVSNRASADVIALCPRM